MRLIHSEKRVVVFDPVESTGDATDFDARSGGGSRKRNHRAREAVFFKGWKIFRHEELDGFQPHSEADPEIRARG